MSPCLLWKFSLQISHHQVPRVFALPYGTARTSVPSRSVTMREKGNCCCFGGMLAKVPAKEMKMITHGVSNMHERGSLCVHSIWKYVWGRNGYG